jgi:transcriptional regulator with XRE-family HTH domain
VRKPGDSVTAERLLEAMATARIGQAELARRVGATPGAINQIASGLTRRSRLLPDIAQELRIPLDWLTGKTDERGEQPPTPVLTADEHRLVAIYRRLPSKERTALKLLIQRMSGKSSDE